MRSLWKGAVSFGLVNIPVRLYAATEEKDVHLRLLHRPCGTPLRQRRHCPACRTDPGPEEVVRGYEYAPDTYALVEEEDLAALPLATDKAVQIVAFVRSATVDPILHHRSYYVEPADGGARAYSLLRQVMEETGRVALARVALRRRESLAVLRSFAGVTGGERAGPRAAPGGTATVGDGGPDGSQAVLLLTTMLWPDEVRNHLALAAALRHVEVDEREARVAKSLVEALADDFRPAEHRDRYREALLELVEAKVRVRRVAAVPPPEPTPADALLAALEESLRAVRAGEGGHGRPRAAGDGATPAGERPGVAVETAP